MKGSVFTTVFVVVIALNGALTAQTRKTVGPLRARPATASRSPEIGQTAIVADDMLSVLRKTPSLFADPVQRMHVGRKVQILGVAEADGVRFYKVTAPPSSIGWVQADAVFGRFRAGDEERLAKLVRATSGFEQVEIAAEFFGLYPDSSFRPAILLLFGDVLEEVAVKLTRDAASKLKRGEMAASAAPLHSYYLNFVSLDRYRKLGIVFLFNSSARAFHYDGASWAELVKKYPKSAEAVEAIKRLDSLKQNMAAKKQ